MEKYIETYNKWVKINTQLHYDCMKYLEDVISKAPDEEIVLNEDDAVTIPYDGGNHPEYASNCFSMVQKVWKKNGLLCFETEDTDAIYVDDVDAYHLSYVCDAVKSTIEKDYDLDHELDIK